MRAMARLRSAAGGVALALALSGAVTAAEAGAQTRFSARYTLSLGGLHLADLAFSGEIAAARYAGQASLATAGLVDTLYRAGFTARASGRRAGGALRPLQFEAESFDSETRQQVAIRYGAGRPQAVTARPPFKPKPWQVDPRAQTGATDPLTAALALFAPQPRGRLCDRAVESFDGRKRVRLSLGPPERRGARIRCPATYERLAGFKPARMGTPAVELAVWFAETAPDLWSLDRAAAPTSYGTAVLKRRGDGG